MTDFDQRLADALGRSIPERPEIEPVWADVVARAERGSRGARRWKPVLVAAVVTLALAGVGVAIADGFGAFDGIGSAQHPQTPSDVIDPATRAYMAHSSMPSIRGLLFDTARHVGQLPDGQDVYVITTTWHGLCTVVGPPGPEWECNDPLIGSHVSTMFVYANNPAISPVTLGVTRDGITSVSFKTGVLAHGPEVTAPVNGNLWTYQGVLAAPPLIAHFADGTTLVDQCPMC